MEALEYMQHGLLFVEIIFRVRTITFRDISLFKMQNGHPLTHIFSSQLEYRFLTKRTAQTVFFVGIPKNYLSESAAAFALSSKERLLPKEALGKGSNEANFNEETKDCFQSSQHCHWITKALCGLKEATSVKGTDTEYQCFI